MLEWKPIAYDTAAGAESGGIPESAPEQIKADIKQHKDSVFFSCEGQV